jgi:FixJ family two-component response regulator
MKEETKYRIYIIDDDLSVRRGLAIILAAEGYQVETFDSSEDFISSVSPDECGCILLDIFLSGESGLELQDIIKYRFPSLPIIYITGHGDVPMSVQALKKGALNFLQKPVDEKDLIISIDEAIRESVMLAAAAKERDEIKSRFGSLTPRESAVFRLILTGMLNKQIAYELKIAEHTVKLHRGKITEKLGVKSVAEMVHLAEKIDIR